VDIAIVVENYSPSTNPSLVVDVYENPLHVKPWKGQYILLYRGQNRGRILFLGGWNKREGSGI
jgi:hypothetical protein